MNSRVERLDKENNSKVRKTEKERKLSKMGDGQNSCFEISIGKWPIHGYPPKCKG